MCDTKNYEQTWREATNVSTARTDGDIPSRFQVPINPVKFKSLPT